MARDRHCIKLIPADRIGGPALAGAHTVYSTRYIQSPSRAAGACPGGKPAGRAERAAGSESAGAGERSRWQTRRPPGGGRGAGGTGGENLRIVLGGGGGGGGEGGWKGRDGGDNHTPPLRLATVCIKYKFIIFITDHCDEYHCCYCCCCCYSYYHEPWRQSLCKLLCPTRADTARR